jgi:ATP-dependent Clp protease adaptor protein ClpS
VPPIAVPEIAPTKSPAPGEKSDDVLDSGYVVIGWDDPVNLMSYVTHVLQTVFAWPRDRAERHMMEIHTKGKSLLAREGFEKAEHLVHQLQQFGLHATMERAE